MNRTLLTKRLGILTPRGKNFETIGPDPYGEMRTVGTISAQGDNFILQAQGRIEILEITVQNRSTSAIVIQHFEGAAALSGIWEIQSKQFWSAPGKVFNQFANLNVNLGSAGLVSFEVRWIRRYAE